MAMTPKPRNAPTAMAAGRSRPAREVFFGWVSATGCGCLRGGFAGNASDLQQLTFLVLDQIVDLAHVLRGGLVEVLFRPADLVLARFAVLLDPGQLLHRLAADVSHGDLRVLALAPGLFGQIAATLLRELRDGDADDVAVVARVHPEVGIPDRILDRSELRLLVRLDDDHPRLGHVDAR